MKGKGSRNVPIWTTELMKLADGLDVGVKGDFSWSLSSRRNGTAMCSDGKSKFRKPIISSV